MSQTHDVQAPTALARARALKATLGGRPPRSKHEHRLLLIAQRTPAEVPDTLPIGVLKLARLCRLSIRAGVGKEKLVKMILEASR